MTTTDNFEALKQRLKTRTKLEQKYLTILTEGGHSALIAAIVDDMAAGILVKDKAISLLQHSHDSIMNIAIEYNIKLKRIEAKAEAPDRQFRWGMIVGLILSIFLELIGKYLRSLI